MIRQHSLSPLKRGLGDSQMHNCIRSFILGNHHCRRVALGTVFFYLFAGKGKLPAVPISTQKLNQ